MIKCELCLYLLAHHLINTLSLSAVVMLDYSHVADFVIDCISEDEGLHFR